MNERTNSDNEGQEKEDEVLRRMLNTKPKPHKDSKVKARSKPDKRPG